MLFTDDLSSLILGCTVFPLLDNALFMLEEKITRIERGYKNYLFVSAAYGLILSQEYPERAAYQKSEAIERATGLYARILTLTGQLSAPTLPGIEPVQVFLCIPVSVGCLTKSS